MKNWRYRVPAVVWCAKFAQGDCCIVYRGAHMLWSDALRDLTFQGVEA